PVTATLRIRGSLALRKRPGSSLISSAMIRPQPPGTTAPAASSCDLNAGFHDQYARRIAKALTRLWARPRARRPSVGTGWWGLSKVRLRLNGAKIHGSGEELCGDRQHAFGVWQPVRFAAAGAPWVCSIGMV